MGSSLLGTYSLSVTDKKAKVMKGTWFISSLTRPVNSEGLEEIFQSHFMTNRVYTWLKAFLDRLGMKVSPQVGVSSTEVWYPSGMLHTQRRKLYYSRGLYMYSTHGPSPSQIVKGYGPGAISRPQRRPVFYVYFRTLFMEATCLKPLFFYPDQWEWPDQVSSLFMAALGSKTSTYKPWGHSFTFKQWQRSQARHI